MSAAVVEHTTDTYRPTHAAAPAHASRVQELIAGYGPTAQAHAAFIRAGRERAQRNALLASLARERRSALQPPAA